jgi:hypothetical protein
MSAVVAPGGVAHRFAGVQDAGLTHGHDILALTQAQHEPGSIPGFFLHFLAVTSPPQALEKDRHAGKCRDGQR